MEEDMQEEHIRVIRKKIQRNIDIYRIDTGNIEEDTEEEERTEVMLKMLRKEVKNKKKMLTIGPNCLIFKLYSSSNM